ncbi:hypothetical protein CO110_05440 [Candidatus Desantisbacteria bacterium CG_4_9_14_3_um_filter_40_11]|nr:MAG: hypothetical protein COX18_07515 [Candidatus Desantisbacteria bacterium CG23_combo_of_CG06-09_8_20_14_all_40_23]PIY19810.1 MAG: hypothetical protein COZ13_03435 [Candidatus Desantisbacteria bacterium CG_4_10_14_3_um_filter_40_18]PJB29510.1 MAG: hypothetical protein CO110_05440 [Candidatus Desantisbacteria bacterium CG_4_9_14_3_um_filter_40_11]
MEVVVENVKKLIQELILPEIGIIKDEYLEIKSILLLTNKRIDDINTHLADQSRRIDGLRVELKEEIAKNTARIDETNKRIDETNKRIDGLDKSLTARIDETNKRMDRLYDVVVRRDDHKVLERRIVHVEQVIEGMKEELLKLAA